VNPEPAGCYNLAVLGAGTAGLVTAVAAAGLGAKVALIEKHLMGGDCLNVGCVPSKALLRAGRAASAVRRAPEFGIDTEEPRIDFARVMERMRRVRADISPHDSAERLRGLGIDVFLGAGRFASRRALEVEGKTLRFSRAVIATGARAAIPPVPGLGDIAYLTNETLFSLTELPRRLGVIGAGPIGCEMAQCFARLGAEVHLVETAHGVLPREDREAAEIVRHGMENDGVKLLCCGKKLRVSRAPDAEGVQLELESHDRPYCLTVDRVLIAAGRAPNVEGLGLEAAGVARGKRGVTVDDRLRTTNPRIYACGDVCSEYQFTHAADFLARTVVQNALFMGRARASALLIPWCTYTSPEIAHVGLYENHALEKGIDIVTFTQPLNQIDRALIDGEADGFVRVHVRQGSDRILGATVVAAHAGEMISELTLAMRAGMGLKAIGTSIHPYPTQAEAIRRLGDVYNRTRLTPGVKKGLAAWFSWRRR
jgi:pyruvate/2-oxoglutarate dehydrogenase complex dihydrolipoamide dehydrogenase (E3) component